jgi:deazaflavin-dependent oxidoreductase (nitroreductase family)
MVRKMIGTMLVAIVGTAVVFVVGLRTKSPGVRRAVRRVSRATRGLTVDRAGQPGAYASLVRHVGRSSGRPYETPVRAAETDDGVIITLPYGADTDWVKNVLASGNATIVHEGRTFGLQQPEIVSDGMQYFPAKDQRTQRLFGLDEYLRLRRVRSGGS